MSRLLFFSFLLVLLVCSGAAGCLEAKTWRTQETPWTQKQVRGADQVRVKRADGSTITMQHASIGSEEGQPYITGSETDPVSAARRQFRVPLADVTRLEIRKTSWGHVLVNFGLGLGSAFVLVVLYGLISAVNL